VTTTFVGGFLRSGTTLVQSVLCAAPGMHGMVGEVLALRGPVEGLARTLMYFDQHGRDYFDDPADAVAVFGGQMQAFVERARARWGCTHVALKHPQLTPQFPLMARALPDARFVVVVRDPRDVVASALEGRARGADEFEGWPPRQIAAMWSRYATQALQSTDADYTRRLHVVRYEDLVRSPGPAVQKLAAATGLDLSGFDPEATVAPELQSGDRPTRPLHSPLYGRALSPKRIGRYAQVLTPAQVAAVEAATGPVRAALGYR